MPAMKFNATEKNVEPLPNLDSCSEQMTGHSIFCVYDVLNGRVSIQNVEIIYLSSSVLERLDSRDTDTRMRVAGVLRPNYLADEGVRRTMASFRANAERYISKGSKNPDIPLMLYDRVAEMWRNSIIRPRPAELGPVGHAYWMRGDEHLTMPWGNERTTTDPALI